MEAPAAAATAAIQAAPRLLRA